MTPDLILSSVGDFRATIELGDGNIIEVIALDGDAPPSTGWTMYCKNEHRSAWYRQGQAPCICYQIGDGDNGMVIPDPRCRRHQPPLRADVDPSTGLPKSLG